MHGQDRFCWSCGYDFHAAPAQAARPTPPELGQVIGLLLRRAHLAQQRGQLEEAVRLVREALKQEPESVPALSLLAELLRASGDTVGAVEAAQQATQSAASRGAPPGALRRAREERAAVEQQVLGKLSERAAAPGDAALAVLTGSGSEWYRSAVCYLSLAFLGFVALLLAFVSLFRGALLGYAWFAVSILAAGWCYYDAEVHDQPGLFWGPLVLCLGPFGLAVYLLCRGR